MADQIVWHSVPLEDRLLPMSPRLAEIIRGIEHEILKGALLPGSKLPSEDKLCEQFRASRTMIREAIQQLRGRGMLKALRGSGTYIATPSLDTLTSAMQAYSALVVEAGFLELIDFRILIETECARLSAVNAGESILKKLQAIISSMKKVKNVRLKFSEADINFHLTIAKGSGNRIYAGVLVAMQKRFVDYARTNRGSTDWYAGVIDAHQEIYDAIAAGLPDQAAEAMRLHLISSKRHFVDLREDT